MSTWYYADADQQRQGPLSTDELKQYFRRQGIALETLVWRDGMLHWRPLGELAEQLGLTAAAVATTAAEPVARSAVPQPPALRVPPEVPTPAPPPMDPPEPAVPEPRTSGRAVFNLGNDPREPAPVVPSLRPEIHTGVVTPVAAPTDREQELNPYRASNATLDPRRARVHDDDVVYAGFWKRAAAIIVDSLIIGLVARLGGEALGAIIADLSGGGQVAVMLTTAAMTLLLYALYFAFFHSAFNQATPGKMIVGIRVLRSDGEPIGFLRGLARYFATIPSGILLGIGYLMAAFTERKRALHDMLCDTVVVDKWAYTPQPGMQQRELGTAAWVILIGYALLIAGAVVAVLALGWFSGMGRGN